MNTSQTLIRKKNKLQKTKIKVSEFMSWVRKRNPGESEFLQAVQEVAETVIPIIEKTPRFKGKKILERMTEPERVLIFRIPWCDTKGVIQINRGYRVQMNSAIGPYKGGLRFHPSVNLSILKFLAFEQVFKNALTTLPMGGAKGGADFDPKGRTDGEIMRFCQAFMTELSHHVGPNTDIPAGDIGVGKREIGFLFGQYKRIKNQFVGVITGKSPEYGGSLIRPEATGYGAVYFADEMLETIGENFHQKRVSISGSGNVAQFAIEKIIELGGTVVTASDSSGYVYDIEGITRKKLDFLMKLKNVKRGRIKEYADKFGCEFYARKKPWRIKVDVAMPCATQNELDEKSAKNLVANGCKVVCEGANMPCTSKAIAVFHKSKILFAPGKSANAGGVSVSGLEISQNSMGYHWSREEVDEKLKEIITNIHTICLQHGKENGYVNYVKGANIAGFLKVADAMLEQGLV